MFTVHATKKLLDRVKAPLGGPSVESSTALGNWYATALFWQPRVALFVNEPTLLPVLVPLAPAKTLINRFPAELGRVLDRLGLDPRFVNGELSAMDEGRFAKTASRSVLGSMNEFSFLADAYRHQDGAADLTAMSLWLAGTPCGPLYQSEISPDQEVRALVARAQSG